ncbi:MAG: Hsp20/alpha crystallin family protein [Bacteroidota bacterium]
MYPGTACNRYIPAGKVEVLHFKEIEDEKNMIDPALLMPAVNISETATEYLVVMAAPGLHRDDFCIEINQSVITISAQKEIFPADAVNDRCEYNYTDWTRAFSLPPDAEALLAHAEYRNGELIIRIPRDAKSGSCEKITIYVY